MQSEPWRASRARQRLNGRKPVSGHFGIAKLIRMQLVGHVGERHRAVHVRKKNLTPEASLVLADARQERIEVRLNLSVPRFGHLSKAGDYDLCVEPVGGHSRD